MLAQHEIGTPQAGAGARGGAGKSCVLVVDDERALRMLLVRVLKDEGHDVLEAGDGAQALDLLEGDGGGIDLVLTDIRMPRLDGLELGRRIAMWGRPLPVVYMSADPPAALVGRALGAGTPACLQKPFSVAALVTLVNRLLGGTSAQAAAAEQSLASA